MQATRIIAIRHGETAWNVDTRIQGQLDIGLNATGRQQVRRLARALADEPIDAIYASDLTRAMETAAAIAMLKPLALHPTQGLRERCFGEFEGRTYGEIETLWPEQAERWRARDASWAPAGGESLLEFRQRVTRTTSELAAQHLGEQIVLVAHGGVMDVLYRTATGQGWQTSRSWNLGNAVINRLLWTPDGMTLVGWADARHLEGDEALDEASA